MNAVGDYGLLTDSMYLREVWLSSTSVLIFTNSKYTIILNICNILQTHKPKKNIKIKINQYNKVDK